MKKLSTLALVFAAASAAIAASPAWAATQKWSATFPKGTGAAEFYAIGRPSALHINGKGAQPEGKLTIDGEQVKGQFDADLQQLETGISMRDRHMKEKYLEVQKYPKATLKVTELKLPKPLAKGADETFTDVPFKGLFTLHGVEKPVEGKSTLTAAGGKLTGAADFSVHISDFGIPTPGFAGITMADEVKVHVQGTGALSPQ